MFVCALCGEQIEPADPLTWQRVTGWERKALAASRRRGSDIALREQLPEFAHSRCVNNHRLGIITGQQELL